MDKKLTAPELPINASPVADHRRQMLLQVWLPLGISIFIVLVLVILTVVGAAQDSPQISRFGNLSAVLVIIPVLFVGTLLLVLVLAMVYGMSKLLKNMPGWMLSLQLRLVHISLVIRRAADSVTRPIVTANTTTARIRRLWNRFIRRKQTI
jgi:ABC-type arginine transport system permease subunit